MISSDSDEDVGEVLAASEETEATIASEITMDDFSALSKTDSSVRWKRGRPSTTGEEVGISKAKEYVQQWKKIAEGGKRILSSGRNG